MPKLRVTIIDEVKDRRLKVDLPDDAAMEKLLPALAKKLGLPPAAYQLTHEATGRALSGDQTLASFGVREGDALKLAAAREEAPAVPWLAEEEAVPIWQRVPVWGWGVIGGVVLVIALAGAFLTGLGLRPEPTPTVVEATSPVATSTAMPRPTATPVTPTFTPLPPTDTPVPTSTPRPTATTVPPMDTPMPTATPWPTPTPTPTPTMDADPTVYDNFNNPANEGSYNKGLWELRERGQTGQVAQQNGMLIVTQSEIQDDCTRLAAYHKQFSISAPTFFEVKLMVGPDNFDGAVRLDLRGYLPGGGGWFSSCEIHGYYGAGCYDYLLPKQEGHWYDAGSKQPVDLGTWHTFRIEVDPATMTFSYYIDGQMAGSHVPVDAEELKEAIFQLLIGVCGGEVTGYIDDVRIGPVQ